MLTNLATLSYIVSVISDESVMTIEQMQNIIEFIPTPKKKKSSHKYITTSVDNPAEAFEQLC